MIDIQDKYKCNGCHACLNTCPQKCIHMVQDVEGFLYPEVNKSACISCGKCDMVCPILNNNICNQDALQIGYAAYNKDTDIRLKSSSGGIFTLIAEQIILSGGIVFGAAMDNDCKSVKHVIVKSIDDLEKIRGSKYVQSSIGESFSKAKEALDEGIKVLFTGTPCQIGGLYCFLGRNYPNLYTQDLICHGVPSPLVWKKYVEYLEKENGAVARRIFFRHKKYGWKKYSILVQFSNNKEYINDIHNDVFMKGFLQNIYLRPSCYSCSFKSLKRQADITLADYWGIQNVHSDMDDDKGTSFVWVHSENGKELFNSIRNKVVCCEVSCADALKSNPAAIKSCSLFPKRKEFYEDINNTDFVKLINKHARRSLISKLKSFGDCVLRKILSK